MELVKDQWLTEQLGKDAYNVTLSTKDDATEIDTFDIVAPHHSFFTCKVAGAEVQTIQALLREGFYPVVVSVTLRRSAAQPTLPLRSKSVRLAEATDWIDVAKIAASCFTHDRFHADPHISKETADCIKSKWAREGLMEATSRCPHLMKMLVSQTLGYVTGFLLMKKEGEQWRLDLIGVYPIHQGQGVGKALVNEFLVQAGSCDVMVTTQLTNTASLQLYLRCGFQIQESQYVLHYHS